jgi:hypothetical protein
MPFPFRVKMYILWEWDVLIVGLEGLSAQAMFVCFFTMQYGKMFKKSEPTYRHMISAM